MPATPLTLPVIRPVTPDDAEAIAAIYSVYVLDTPITFEEEPPNADDMRRRIAEITPRYPYLVAELAGRVVGYACGSPHSARASYRWSVNAAIYIDRSAHRRGVGRALYTQLLATLTRQGFVMAYAGITLPNDASVGLHEAMGFRRIALYRNVGYKHGAWRDVAWFERELAPRNTPPQEPTPP